MEPLTAPVTDTKSPPRLPVPAVVGMKLVGTEPSSICGAAKPSSVPTAELVKLVTLTVGPSRNTVKTFVAVIVKVSEHRNTSDPNLSTLRIRFVIGEVAISEPLLNEPLTSNPLPNAVDVAPLVFAKNPPIVCAPVFFIKKLIV